MPSSSTKQIRTLSQKTYSLRQTQTYNKEISVFKNEGMKCNGDEVARVADKDFVYKAGLLRRGEERWRMRTHQEESVEVVGV